jgi:hypothetical protein
MHLPSLLLRLQLLLLSLFLLSLPWPFFPPSSSSSSFR